MIFGVLGIFEKQEPLGNTWMSFLGYGASCRVWAMKNHKDGTMKDMSILWAHERSGTKTSGMIQFIQYVFMKTSFFPMNCIYSAHLLSIKVFEGVRSVDSESQKWPTDGVINLLRWELGQMMWTMWYKPVQVLDDERLYFDSDSLNGAVELFHLTSLRFDCQRVPLFKTAISLTWVWNM